MRGSMKLLAAAACIAAASPALAAPTITGVSVKGTTTNFVWSTAPTTTATLAQDTLFVAPGYGVGVSAVINPNNVYTAPGFGTADSMGDFNFTVYGDGYPTSGIGSGGAHSAPNSDLIYAVSVTIKDGTKTGTLTGTWQPSTGSFLNTSAAFAGSTGIYQLDGFDWGRQLGNYVGKRSTSTASDAGGALRDYRGDFSLTATAVPEPATWALMILGFGAVGMALRKRRDRNPAASIA